MTMCLIFCLFPFVHVSHILSIFPYVHVFHVYVYAHMSMFSIFCPGRHNGVRYVNPTQVLTGRINSSVWHNGLEFYFPMNATIDQICGNIPFSYIYIYIPFSYIHFHTFIHFHVCIHIYIYIIHTAPCQHYIIQYNIIYKAFRLRGRSAQALLCATPQHVHLSPFAVPAGCRAARRRRGAAADGGGEGFPSSGASTTRRACGNG